VVFEWAGRNFGLGGDWVMTVGNEFR
jgi:hypothetical protein